MELISKEKMLEKLAMLPADQFYNLASIRNFIKAEEEAVVRCRDCKHSVSWYRDRRLCYMWSETGIAVFEDGFCNYGGRKEA